MSLLHQIQTAATDSTVDITVVLRKAKILAAHLRNPDFSSWVEFELNGYPNVASLPPYRVLRTRAHRHFIGAFGRELRNAEIMESILPEDLRHWATTAYMFDSAALYASLVAGATGSNSAEMHCPWPQELAVQFASKLYNGMQCISAWQVIPRHAIAAMLETIRTRVLSFALEIEAESPDAGETPLTETPVPQERVSQVFVTTINGGVNNVSAGSPQSSLTNSGQVKGDLISELRAAAVPERELTELKTRLEAAQMEADKKQVAESWFGKFALTAASGSTAAVLGTVAKVIAAHFGVHVP